MSRIRNSITQRVKRYTRKLSNHYRQATWKKRVLPDFIIIGAQKSGTSSLYYYLSQHPKIIPADIKEIHFFDGGRISNVDQFNEGLARYYAHFPLKSEMKNGNRTFEASPSYLFQPMVPARIQQIVPQVKLIALLRNPTQRAISHYLHNMRKGREPLPILEALEQEEARLKPIWESGNFRDSKFTTYSYKSRGLYQCQLERYLQYFSRDQILILPSERFFADPNACLHQIFEFIGVDSGFYVKDLKPKNVSTNKMDISPDVYAYLNDFFRLHNEALYEFLGEDFGW